MVGPTGPPHGRLGRTPNRAHNRMDHRPNIPDPTPREQADPRRGSHDVLVLGGGPAGCAAATLLARRAHRVALVRPFTPPGAGLAESIPPSARRVLEELGALEAVDDAGFHPNRGNAVWWAGGPLRREEFASDTEGFHTDRASLESVLVSVAEAAGVHVHHSTTARSAERNEDEWIVACSGESGGGELSAPWVVDATGRHGFLARPDRVPDRSTTTLALVRRWRKPGGWSDDLEHHTLVESYERGWAWSLPLSPELRCVTAMIDQRHTNAAGLELDGLLDAELDRTIHVGATRHGAEPVGSAWACPASLYTSDRFARRGLLLAGEAGSSIDPLSSFGVKKALSSGWLAGIAAHTALVDPTMADAAVDFFDRREREVYHRYRAISAGFFEEGAEAYGTEFWTARAEAARTFSDDVALGERDPDRLGTDVPKAAILAAFEELKARERLSASRGRSVTAVERAAIDGHRIVLKEHLATDAYPEGLRFWRGVDLFLLVEVAPKHAEVPDGWTAYNAVAPPVTLPDYLTALATAFAAGLLEHE